MKAKVKTEVTCPNCLKGFIVDHSNGEASYARCPQEYYILDKDIQRLRLK